MVGLLVAGILDVDGGWGQVNVVPSLAVLLGLAALATQARAKSLLLYHQLYWGATDADLLREMRQAGYRAPVTSARDLGVY